MNKTLINHTFPPDLSGIYNEELANQLAQTQAAIASLKQMSRLLHNPNLLMRPILAKEAESSSQLEGTQASIDDAYKIDIIDQSPEKRNEALEIRNYEQAMLTGLGMIKRYELNNFVIREIHKTLLKGVRGKNKHPGEFRKGDVWIGKEGTSKGEARYIPPDATQVPGLMDRLEKFVKNRGKVNPLIASAVIHHRFEGIHPFEDGNGRTGRLLISLFLIKEGLLTTPILYPSGFFEKNKKEYMNNLSKVDQQEEWYPWVLFFLQALQNQAEVALDLGLEIDSLFKQSRSLIENETAGLNLIRVLEHTFIQPYITAPIISKAMQYTVKSCDKQTLSEKEVISEVGTFKKQRVFANKKLVNILKKI